MDFFFTLYKGKHLTLLNVCIIIHVNLYIYSINAITNQMKSISTKSQEAASQVAFKCISADCLKQLRDAMN